jgi:hypothetical protein
MPGVQRMIEPTFDPNQMMVDPNPGLINPALHNMVPGAGSNYTAPEMLQGFTPDMLDDRGLMDPVTYRYLQDMEYAEPVPVSTYSR